MVRVRETNRLFDLGAMNHSWPLCTLCFVGGTAVLWVVFWRLDTGRDTQKEHNLPLIMIAVDAWKAFQASTAIIINGR